MYDVWGNPGRTTDGPNDLRFFYDRAGRTTLIRENGGQQRPLKEWTYGTGTGAGDRSKGKVKTAERHNYVFVGTIPYTALVRETYTYGGRGGRVSQRLTENYINPGPGSTPSDSFTQGFVWNDLGDPQSLAYPYRLGLAAGPTISPGYSNGVLTSVPGYASSITYHPNGMLHQVVHTNTVTDSWAPDPNKVQRPASIAASRGMTTLFATGAYSYDGAGNVEKIGSGYFVYDQVSRLVEGRIHIGPSGGGPQVYQTYTFDPYGNITSINTNGVTRNTPTSQSTNRLTSASYDAAGNVTSYNGAVYEYGSFNDLWHYQNGGEEAVYLYTADGERLWEFNFNDKNRWTLRDLDGKVLREYEYDRGTMVWTVERDYVYRDGTLLAAQTPQGVRHFSVDHLGTPRLVTSSAGNQVAYHAYYPFGEEATAFNQDSERMKFTGHERDLHSLAGPGDDLDYMHARFCSPMTGRFLSVDPVSGDSQHPQTWNRYAYVVNNPLLYVDPNGLTVESALSMISYYSHAIEHASRKVGGQVTPVEIARVVFQENRNDHNWIRDHDGWSWLSVLTLTGGGPEYKNQAAMFGFLLFGVDASYGLGEMKASTAARLLGYGDFDSLTPEQRREVHGKLIDPVDSLVLVARHLNELKRQLPNSSTPTILNAYNRGVDNSSIMGEVAKRSGPYRSEIGRALAAGTGPKVVRCNGAFKFEHQCQ